MVRSILAKKIFFSMFLLASQTQTISAMGEKSLSTNHAATSGSSQTFYERPGVMGNPEPTTARLSSARHLEVASIYDERASEYSSSNPSWLTDFVVAQPQAALPPVAQKKPKSFSTRIGERVADMARPLVAPSFDEVTRKLDQGAQRINETITTASGAIETSTSRILQSTADSTAQVLRETGNTLSRVITDTGAILVAAAKETSHLVDTTGKAVGNTILDGIGKNGGMLIRDLDSTLTHATLSLGDQINRLPLTIGQSAENATQAVGQAFAEGIAESGQEVRRNARFFAKTFWQSLGLGSAAVAGGLLAFKHFAKLSFDQFDKKNAFFGSLGLSVAAASVGLAGWLFKKDQEEDNRINAANQQRQDERRAALQARFNTEQNENAQRAERMALAEKSKTDGQIQRVCAHAQRTVEHIDTTLAKHRVEETLEAKTLRIITTQLDYSEDLLRRTFNDFRDSIILERHQLVERRVQMENRIDQGADRDARLTSLQLSFQAELLKLEQNFEYNKHIVEQELAKLNLIRSQTHQIAQVALSNGPIISS